MTEMEHSKLMIPLFYGHSFNREGRKMRAVFEREISDGAQTYRLWRGTGTPDVDYPRAENDKYLLHVEIRLLGRIRQAVLLCELLHGALRDVGVPIKSEAPLPKRRHNSFFSGGSFTAAENFINFLICQHQGYAGPHP